MPEPTPAPPRAPRPPSTRGRLRRRLLVEAAGALLTDEGFAAVTHRAVAARAELPLASTTYYFGSLEELVEEAVRHLADSWLASSRAAVAQLPRQLDTRRTAEALVRVAALGPAGGTVGTGAEPALLLSLYERYVQAARHPPLRAVLADYDTRIEALLTDVMGRCGGDPAASAAPPVPARLVLAVIDGALLRALAEGTDPAGAAAEVQQLLEGFRAWSPTGP